MYMYYSQLPSPLGSLTLASDGTALTGLWMAGQKYFPKGLEEAAPSPALPVFLQAEAWLEAYFNRDALPAPPPLAPQGTPFQEAVWRLLPEVPYGTVTTYGKLAAALQERGTAASPRSVGGAVGRNPISILIPCHRVVGSDGRLTGYAGGVERKRFLLALEQHKAF